MRAALTRRHPGSLATALAMLILAAVLLAGCGSGESDDAGATTQTFGGQQLKQPIEVEAGSSFAFVLDSNETTGYRWALVNKPRASVVTYEGSTYESEPDAGQRVGAGGQETLDFEAVGPGTVEIQLEYAFLGGEQGDKPAETLTAHVTVR